MILEETRKILCDPGLLETREMHFSRLEALYAGERLESVMVLNGIVGSTQTTLEQNPEQWVTEALASLAVQAEAAGDTRVFRPLSLDPWLYGVHFTDRLFGAEVYSYNNQWWSKGLAGPIGELAPPDLDTNETWRLAVRLTEAMVATGVTVPLIGTQVVGAPFNQAFNIYKDELLMAFYDRPQAVRHDLYVVTDTLCRMHRLFRAAIPPQQFQPIQAAGRCQPRGFGQMCGCATQLISPEIYRDFIAPLDEEVLALYPRGGMYHLCGCHTQHIPAWRGMKTLRAIQINDRAAEDLEVYFRELRDDQIIYLNPTPTMTIERALRITGGRRLVIVADIREPLPCACC